MLLHRIFVLFARTSLEALRHENFHSVWCVIGFSTRCGMIVGHLWYSWDDLDGAMAFKKSN